ncbi:MAG: hypothetical protein ABIT64_00640 [Lysobacteraceae bacterium]
MCAHQGHLDPEMRIGCCHVRDMSTLSFHSAALASKDVPYGLWMPRLLIGSLAPALVTVRISSACHRVMAP